MSQITPSDRVRHREDFAGLCNSLELWRAVEIGTDQGVFAASFIQAGWRGHTLCCVDPYVEYPEMPYDRSPDLQIAISRLTPLITPTRSIKIIRVDSLTAANWCINGPAVIGRPDFVYIDGAHDHASINNDIRAWWEALRPGGVLAGHDYHEEFPGILKAVGDFGERENAEVFLTQDSYTNKSWYAFKPKGE